MPTPQDSEDRNWYVLNYIRRSGRPSPNQEVDNFNKTGQRLELFAPIVRPAHIIKGKVVYKDQLLTYYYVFVKGTLDDVKKLCASPHNDLSLMLNRSSEKRYGILSESEMENFKIIARAYANSIPFFKIDDIELEKGDEVEVVDGKFSGLRGTFIPRARSNKGNLVIATVASMGSVVWDLDAKYIRILKFAPGARRQYDILDSFLPKLYPILRKYHSGERLTEKDRSVLTVFNSRMCSVRPDNKKLEAKLLATLMCVQTLLGDVSGYQISASRYAKRKSSVSNPWTIALIELMLCVSGNEVSRLNDVYSGIRDVVPGLTKFQSNLLEELRYYLGASCV